jgi:hypothetical protein
MVSLMLKDSREFNEIHLLDKKTSGYAKDLNLYRLRGWVGID